MPEVEALSGKPLGDRQTFFARVREAAQDVISRKGATYFAIAVVLRRTL